MKNDYKKEMSYMLIAVVHCGVLYTTFACLSRRNYNILCLFSIYTHFQVFPVNPKFSTKKYPAHYLFTVELRHNVRMPMYKEIAWVQGKRWLCNKIKMFLPMYDQVVFYAHLSHLISFPNLIFFGLKRIVRPNNTITRSTSLKDYPAFPMSLLITTSTT